MSLTVSIPHTISKQMIAANRCDLFAALLPEHVKTVSFDCFDTIIWRRCYEPKDVFFEFSSHSVFKQYGIDHQLRINAENKCYEKNMVEKGYSQASLEEIYQLINPNLTDVEINLLTESELEIEMSYCYTYTPILDTMRSLIAQGIDIIITSDTYFSEKNLKKLLKAKLPSDILNGIKSIYTSCDFHTAKYQDLFKTVLKHENKAPHLMVHIGDHPISDVEKPHHLGIHTIHFQPTDTHLAELFRLQALAAPFTDGNLRSTRGLKSPFNLLHTKTTISANTPEYIGYHSVGPILYAFAREVDLKYQQLKAKGLPVKIAYLLRDGYLPSLACDIVHPNLPAANVRISRFSAFASSFRTQKEIDRYLSSRLSSKRYDDMCRQLLLPDKLTKVILQQTEGSKTPALTFCQLIHQEATLNTIIQESKAYRGRLFKYLQHELNLASGDTLMFVDLGYTGTTQICLHDVFRDELQVSIIGCYLISLKTLYPEISKSGLLDHHRYDEKTLSMLITYIALFEQLCTATERSVIDFDQDGKPIFSEVQVNETQFTHIKPIQEAAIQFVKDANTFATALPFPVTNSDFADLAAIYLTRLIYLPTKYENHYFANFKHDVNLGTSDLINIIDIEKGADNLRKRGWLHSLQETSDTARMNYPSEWKALSLNLSILLLSQHKYGFKVADYDLTQISQDMPVLLQTSSSSNLITLPAFMTYDGYYSLHVPIPKEGRIGMQFGAICQAFELYAADKIPLRELHSKTESLHAESIKPKLIFHQMELLFDNLVVQTTDEALLIYADDKKDIDPQICRIIFRPISRQKSVTSNS